MKTGSKAQNTGRTLIFSKSERNARNFQANLGEYESDVLDETCSLVHSEIHKFCPLYYLLLVWIIAMDPCKIKD